MRYILSLVAAVALMFTACESTNDNAENQQIKLTTKSELKVGSGNIVGFIQFDILEFISGAKVVAEANVDWIYEFDYTQQGKIGFKVATNPNGEPREGIITLTYDKSKLEVRVIQALNEDPSNKTIIAEYLQGKYYGYMQGFYNYYLIFSDLGMDKSGLYSTPNAHYYFVDLYLDVEPSDMENITVPVGVYGYDINDQPIGDTFKHQWSWYQINDENGVDTAQIRYEDGLLTIEDGKVTLNVTLEVDYRMENHTIIYEGDLFLLDCRDENTGY